MNLLVCATLGVAALASTPVLAELLSTSVSLKAAAAPYFAVGVGVNQAVVRQPENQPLLQKHFTHITAENCMKFNAVQPRQGDFRFEQSDAFVDLAEQLDLKVVGHCLVWAKDDRTPKWFATDGEHDVTADVLLHRMKTHVETVATRYRGRIDMWDVVNEAIGNDEEGYLRVSLWSRLLGEEFLVKAFEYAHAADPDAILMYNDYRCDVDAKRRARLIRMLKMLKSRNAPVHAFGLQGHYEIDNVPYEGIEETLKAMRQLDIKLVVSELDIDVVKRGRWWANGGAHRDELKTYDPYKDGCPPEILARQAEQYAQLFELFQEYHDVVLRVSFWNLHDGESWLNHFPWERVNHPLLFDRKLEPKPAFDAVIGALSQKR
ncbi:MAG: endo-1,4-beta-xylanase [Planctomycetota bacterium]